MKKFKETASFIFFILAGGWIGYQAASFGLNDGLDAYGKGRIIAVVLLTPVWYLLVVGLHELGHVVAGKSQDFDFFGLTVGPFSWRPDADGRIRLSRNRSLNLSGGVAFMLPRGEHDLAKRFAWYGAGGPLASLLLAVAAYLLKELTPEGSFIRLALAVISFLSAAIFLVTAIPFRSGGFSSDGMRIITFLRGGATAEADLLALQIIAAQKVGQGYDAMPIVKIRELSQTDAVPEQQRINLRYYDYLYRLHAGDPEGAAEQLAYIMDNLDVYPAGIDAVFHVEAALYHGVYRGDLASAEAAWANYKSSPLVENVQVSLVELALARLKNEPDTAALEAKIAAELPNSMDQNRRPYLERWLAVGEV